MSDNSQRNEARLAHAAGHLQLRIDLLAVRTQCICRCALQLSQNLCVKSRRWPREQCPAQRTAPAILCSSSSANMRSELPLPMGRNSPVHTTASLPGKRRQCALATSSAEAQTGKAPEHLSQMCAQKNTFVEAL